MPCYNTASVKNESYWLIFSHLPTAPISHCVMHFDIWNQSLYQLALDAFLKSFRHAPHAADTQIHKYALKHLTSTFNKMLINIAITYNDFMIVQPLL